MKEFWVKFKDWWMQLSLREQQTLSLGTIVVAVFLLYELIWSPLLKQINDMRASIPAQQAMLVWMQGADKILRSLEQKAKPNTTPLSPIELLSVLKNNINEMNLSTYLLGLKEANQETIAVQFQKIEFDRLMLFLITLVKAHPIIITQLAVTADTMPGIVNAELLLKSV